MDLELLLNELSEITDQLLVVHNYDPSNDLLEELYLKARNMRDMLEEELS